MAHFLSFLCNLCQPKPSSVNCDSNFGSGARLATSHENEEVSDSVKPSLDASSSSQQLCVARVSSKTRPASSARGLSSDKPEDPIGLKLFNAKNSNCEDSGDYQVDVIAVHGLDGHRESTWACSEGAKQGSQPDPLWLRDFLPQDLPGSRIFTYGYNSQVLASRSVSWINDYALKLLNDLHTLTKQYKVGELLDFV